MEQQKASKRGRRSRERLLDAAERLLGQASIGSYSIDEIAAEAQVAKGTFYNNFDDRDQLADAAFTRARNEVSGLVKHLNEGVTDPAMKIARCTCVYARLAWSKPERARMLATQHALNLSMNHPANLALQLVVAEGIESGRFQVTTREVGVLAVVSIIATTVQRLLISAEGLGASSIVQQLTSMLLRSLGLPPLDADRIASQATDAIFHCAQDTTTKSWSTQAG